MMSRRHFSFGAAAAIAAAPKAFAEPSAVSQVTILFDAFGESTELKRGWGYSALIEFGGWCVLFDAGAQGAIFARNAATLGINLKEIDLAVVSHRHNDHTAGLNLLLKKNPDLPIHTPVEPAGFNARTPAALFAQFMRTVPEVPDKWRYFDGTPPAENFAESPWPQADFRPVSAPIEVLPSFHLFSVRSDRKGTLEMNEVSLLVDTPRGGALFVGCSHPGIEAILAEAIKINPKIYTIFGGLHLVGLEESEVSAIVASLRDKWNVERVAVGHCTGQFAFSEILRVFGHRVDFAGVGSVVGLPA